MPLLVIDGPETAGKSTIIREVTRMVGYPTRIRKHSKSEDWLEYLPRLVDDLADSEHLVIWDRGWASEFVYNRLLSRRKKISEAEIEFAIELPLRIHSCLKVMVRTDPVILAERRERRKKRGDHNDLNVDPAEELDEFFGWAMRHGWTLVWGQISPTEVAQAIIRALHLQEKDDKDHG